MHLEVMGGYGKDGWQHPETGQEFFNDRIKTRYGQLGKLKSEFENGFPVIVQADEVVLIRRGFPRHWEMSTTGVTVERSPFGFQLFELIGKNGMVRYQLLEDELQWKGAEAPPPLIRVQGSTQDDEGSQDLSKWQIGVRTYSKWMPVFETPERYRSQTTTTVIQEPT